MFNLFKKKDSKLFIFFNQKLKLEDERLNKASATFDSKYSSRYKNLYENLKRKELFKTKSTFQKIINFLRLKEIILILTAFSVGIFVPVQMGTRGDSATLLDKLKQLIQFDYKYSDIKQIQEIQTDSNQKFTKMITLLESALEANLVVKVKKNGNIYELLLDGIDINNEDQHDFLVLLPSIPKENGTLKIIIN